MKIAISKATIMVVPIMFSGCYNASEFFYHDPFIRMHEYEIVNVLQNKDGKKIKKTATSNIRPTDAVYDPEEPRAIEDKIVSINVTEETPIVDVIMELARMSGTDIQIDPTIIGGVNLSLKDKPLRYVFNRICGLSDTRYDEKYGIVVFSRDLPYTKTYDIDFLDVSRSTSSSITLNTSGLSSSTSVGGGTSTVTTKSDDTFWNDIIKDIKQIIDTTENTNKIYTSTAERIQRIAQNEEEENKMQEDINNGIYNKNVDSNKKTEKTTDVKAKDTDKPGSTDDRIRINKRAGILTVTASTKSHRLIEKYLAQLKKKSTSQVLIEMRFLEINLKKEYQAGINWNNIKLGQIGRVSGLMGGAVASNALATLTFNKGIDAVASLFEKFGSTRTLSNPRINAVNNQPALMTFATNYVYFKTKSTYTPAQYNSDNVVLTPAYRNVDSEAQTMPLGIIMSVLPSIDVDKHEVMLNIKPTISKLEGTVKDPAVTILLNDDGSSDREEQENNIPVANVRELDTILKLKDGQTAVIGGFTERSANITSAGVPILRSLPLFGNLFNQKNNATTSTETVILVKATIVDYGKSISEYERGIFDKMADDPRSNEI